MDQQIEFRESIKNYLQQEGIYNVIKSQIAATVMGKLMSRQIEEKTFEVIELPTDDDTQAYIYEMLLFLKQFGLNNTLKVFMMEAGINIEHAKESAARSPGKSPVKAQMDNLRGIQHTEQNPIPVQPQQVTEIPNFDFDNEDIAKVEEEPKEKIKQRPELAKVVDHDDDALGKIVGDFQPDETSTHKKKKKQKKHKEPGIDEIINQYDMDNANNDFDDGFDDIDKLENEVHQETPKKHHKKHKSQDPAPEIVKSNASLEQINDLDDQNKKIKKIQDINKQVMDKINDSGVGQDIDLTSSKPQDEEKPKQDVVQDFDELDKFDEFDDLNSDNAKNVPETDKQANIDINLNDDYLNDFEDLDPIDDKQDKKESQKQPSNDFYGEDDLDYLKEFETDEIKDEKKKEEKPTTGQVDEQFDFEDDFGVSEKEQAKEAPKYDNQEENMDLLNDLENFDDLLEPNADEQANDKPTDKPKDDPIDETNWDDLDKVGSGAKPTVDDLDDFSDLDGFGQQSTSKGGKADLDLDNLDEFDF